MKEHSTCEWAALYAEQIKIMRDVSVRDLERFCETQSVKMNCALLKAALLCSRPKIQSTSVDNRSRGSPRLDNWGPPIIINGVTPRCHNRDPEYSLPSETESIPK